MRLPLSFAGLAAVRPLATLCAAAFGAAIAAPCQCPVQTVVLTNYGQGCTPVFQQVPTLNVVLDPVACRLDLSVAAFPGCCNTFLSAHLLMLGVAPANLPLPVLGPGCTLLTSPDVLMFQPRSGGGTFPLALPPALPLPLTVFAQPGALYFTTIGMTDDLSIGAGTSIALN